MKIKQLNFNKNLTKNYLFEKNPYVAVATSGGPDSMALTFLLKKWTLLKNGKLIALIVDHQLRINSSSEAKYIKNYLKFNNIESKILKIKKTDIKKRTMNEARINRFNKILNYCFKENILSFVCCTSFR